MPNPIQNLILPSFDFNLNQSTSIFLDIPLFQSNNITYDSFNGFESSDNEPNDSSDNPYKETNDLASFFSNTFSDTYYKSCSFKDELENWELSFNRLWENLRSVYSPMNYGHTSSNTPRAARSFKKHSGIPPRNTKQNNVSRTKSLIGNMGSKIKGFTERFISPVTGRITSGYGDRIHPTLHYKKFHNGIDIAAAEGTPVFASAGGTVIKVDNNGTGPSGKHIVIRHSSGYTSSYCHLSSTNTVVGQSVSQKDFIGRVGSTGRSTGPHLHFTLRRGNSTENPLNHLHHA